MWYKVCQFKKLQTQGALVFHHDEKEIGLFHTAEGVFAIANLCPHNGAELHPGLVKNGKVFCPWHAWPFDLKTGICTINPSFNAQVFPVKVEGGAVWVDPYRSKKTITKPKS